MCLVPEIQEHACISVRLSLAHRYAVFDSFPYLNSRIVFVVNTLKKLHGTLPFVSQVNLNFKSKFVLYCHWKFLH